MPASCHSSSAYTIHLSRARPAPLHHLCCSSIMHGRRKFDPPYPTEAQILGLSALLGPPAPPGYSKAANQSHRSSLKPKISTDICTFHSLPVGICSFIILCAWSLSGLSRTFSISADATFAPSIYTQLSRLLPFDLNHPLPLPLEPIYTLTTYTSFLFLPASHRHTFTTGPSSSAV